jgi:hypothetical protein
MHMPIVHVLNQRNAPTDDRHTVATLDVPFLLAIRIPTLAPLNQHVERRCLKTGIP